MALLTLTEYKALRGITGADHDAQITAYLAPTEADVIAFCNSDFGGDFPAGLKLVAADMIAWRLSGGASSGKASESIEGYSYTIEQTGESGYPLAIEKALTRYQFLKPRIVEAKYELGNF
jgi:hypothetical protein